MDPHKEMKSTGEGINEGKMKSFYLFLIIVIDNCSK